MPTDQLDRLIHKLWQEVYAYSGWKKVFRALFGHVLNQHQPQGWRILRNAMESQANGVAVKAAKASITRG